MLVKLLSAVAGLTLIFGDHSTAADAPYIYDVGVSTVDITPDYPIRLNGFGNRREESMGVSQRIYAKAMAIGDPTAALASGTNQNSPLVLVTLDSLGIRQSMVDEVAQRLMKSHKLPPANLAITFTHSHCAPKVNGASDNIFSQAIPDDHQKHIDRYTEELTNYIATAAQQALDGMKPARLDWSVGTVKFAKNRRLVGGPLDHDLPMLVVRDPKTLKPRAVYVSYACHCVTLSFNQISGDWAGYAAHLIEREFPNAVAMVSIGAGSDQNPVSGVTGDKVQVAESQGLEIASEVKRLLKGDLRPIAGRPKSISAQIPLALNKLPTREELVAQTGKGRPTDRYNATTQLQRLDRGEPLLKQIDYAIQTWTFGESLCMTFLAGEVCVDYATRLKRELNRDLFWLNAYSNDFCCYIPSERLVAEGGYGGGAEVPYFALPTTLKAGLEQKIVDEVRRQAPKAFHVPEGTQGVPPKAPKDALKYMQTAGDFKVLLAAAEPQVTDPVAIDFGPDGRLWVAEMNDYGRDVYEAFPQGGRIRWLRDTDNDGFFESSETFVDNLRFPTDVKVWRDGVLICDAPHIIFARDEDNDGKAEKVTQLFSGFEVRNAQARVNSLRFGLDDWIYGASGLFGGKITSSKTGLTVDCSNRDFRLNADTGVIEAVAGRTQQGRCRNDWGDWFGCSNGTLLRSIPSDDYQRRNPFASPDTLNVIALDAEALKLYAPQDLVTFELSGAPGRATAACGLGIYRDVVLGGEFQNDAFTCEPVHQSVHRIDFRPGDDGYLGRRGEGEESREFLSSTDRWFRPVQVRTGPDGALWVVDMYRYVIEHSRWIPQSSLEKLDVYAGQGRGRIYRVLPSQPHHSPGDGQTPSPSTASRLPAIPNLSQLSDEELALQLKSSNGPLRDTAHQMLLWRAPKRVSSTIRKIASESTQPGPQIQALAVLNGLEQLTAEMVLKGLQSPHEEVQRFAAKLSEPFLPESPALKTALIGLASSKEMRTRRQAVLSLGATSDAATAQAIARRLTPEEPSRFVRSAALNSVSKDNVGQVVQEFLELSGTSAPSQTDWRRLAVLSIQVGDAATLHQTVTKHLPPTSELPTGRAADLWVSALNALDARAQRGDLPKAFDDAAEARRLFNEALAAIQDVDRQEAEHLGALKLLGRKFGPYSLSTLTTEADKTRLSSDSRARAMARYISPRYPASLQERAMTAVSSTGADVAAELLVNAYPSLNSRLRAVVVNTLLGQVGGQAAILAAIENGDVRVASLNADQRNKLLSDLDPAMLAAAERVLGGSSTSSRAEVVKAMQGAIEGKGSVERGRVAFRKSCSACHRLEDHGHVVGPDLAALTNRDPNWLLTTILDPNKNVDARYLSWSVLTHGGRTMSGMIVEETAAAIRLREAGGKEHLIARTDIDRFRSSQKSVMPEGLERDMSEQDLSDVIAYLGSQTSPPKRFAGNTPAMVRPNSDGALMLTATTAEIRGSEIRFEAPFANIGYWHHQSDSAMWQIEVPQSGEYDIYINASCSSEAAGNEFQVIGLSDIVTGKVASTGGWDRYRQHRVGAANLAAGQRVITVQATSPVKGALFDLREVRLVPLGQAPKFAIADVTKTPLPRYPPEIAPFLLDGSQTVERRQQVIDQRPGMGPAIIQLLVADLKPGDQAEARRRIPWIWRVAISVAKRNDGGEIRDVLEISVPKISQPLQEWQAVVIGGGLINGASQLGLWPKERMNEILKGLPAVQAAWPHALKKSMTMADDEQVKMGTRYDALRMVALLEDPEAESLLIRRLKEGTPRELQMGAVSGLVDLNSENATRALRIALSHLEARNRQLAIEGMLRTDLRAAALEDLIRTGNLTLSDKEAKALREHPLADIRRRVFALGIGE